MRNTERIRAATRKQRSRVRTSEKHFLAEISRFSVKKTLILQQTTAIVTITRIILNKLKTIVVQENLQYVVKNCKLQSLIAVSNEVFENKKVTELQSGG